MAPSITSVQALTLEYIAPTLADNVFLANATTAYLLSGGRVKIRPGGRFIQKPVIWASNTTVMAYSGYDRLDTTAQEEITAAQYNWRQIAVNVSISGLEEMQNDGPEAILDLWTAKVKIAEMSLQQFLNQKICGSAALKDPNKDFLGFDELIEDTATGGAAPASHGGTGLVGGLQRGAAADQQFWNNRYKTSTLATITQDMRTIFNYCSEGNAHPDLIVTTQELYEGHVNQNAGKQILTNPEMMKIGFPNVSFYGATMFFDRHIQGSGTSSGLMYFVNTDFLDITLHRRRNFAMRQRQDAFDQDAMQAFILLGGNMTLDNSRFQGVLEVGTV